MDVVKADTLTYTRWLEGEFYYHDVPLSFVIEDLCRYYDCQPADFLCEASHDIHVALRASRKLSLRQIVEVLNKSNGLSIRVK